MKTLDDEIEFLREEMFSVVSETLKIPKDMLKPHCPVIDFTQRFKELDKPIFEDEVVIKIEGVEK